YPAKREEVWGGVSDDDGRSPAKREEFVKKFPEKVFVHRSDSNSSTFTFDGVDMMGERLANEVFLLLRTEGWVKEDLICGSFVRRSSCKICCGKLYEQ
ncbi:hypothetical protein Bca52824_033833, partial [Brassica carinata]